MISFNNYILEKLKINKKTEAEDNWSVDDFVSYLNGHGVVVDNNKSKTLSFIELPKRKFPYITIYFRNNGWMPSIGDILQIWYSYSNCIEIDTKDYFQMDKAKNNCLYNEDNAKVIIKLLLRAATR